uniref:Reverse transcriptase/retrotransposon-derived protein RNase H-like domain-containing protein n=1 Tax=Arundo donax TaxID=35708 RepID=A0A0A8YMW5_ARUDO
MLTSAPMLQLPDFNSAFIVECDASGSGFGAILHQGGGPLAFFTGLSYSDMLSWPLTSVN